MSIKNKMDNCMRYHLYAELTVRHKRASGFRVFMTYGVVLTLFIKKCIEFFYCLCM